MKKGGSILIIFIYTFVATQLWGQSSDKKPLGHEELISWNTIKQTSLSNDGQWVAYHISPEEGDGMLMLHDQSGSLVASFDRGTRPSFTDDNKYLIFSITPHQDSIKNQKRRKVKKDDQTKDTLAIYQLANATVEKIPDVKSFQIEDKWADWIVYHMEPVVPEKDTVAKDTSAVGGIKETEEAKSKEKKPKKEGKDNGSTLVIRSLKDTSRLLVPFVTKYTLAEEKPALLLHSTGDDESFAAGVYYYRGEELLKLIESANKCQSLVLNEQGDGAALMLQADTTKSKDAPHTLFFWQPDADTLKVLADTLSTFIPEGWKLAVEAKPVFSSDGSKLFFGIQPSLPKQDTMLLDEEIARVEVWHWQDEMLHTQQTVRKEEESKRSYDICYDISKKTFTSLNDLELQEITYGDERDANVVIIYDERPYLKNISWEGFPAGRDVYLLDVQTGNKTLIGENIRGTTRLSPKANYVYWYAKPDSLWMIYDISTDITHALKVDKGPVFYDEEFDMPDHPSSYGMMGWSVNDQDVLLYDRYDIWKFDPSGSALPIRLTDGREQKLVYRYIQLDPEERSIPLGSGKLLLYIFHEESKQSGYAYLDPSSSKLEQVVIEKKNYSRSPIKARDAAVLLFTQEDFNTFPDWYLTKDNFKSSFRISNANPQQKQYLWGTVEPYQWTSLDGVQLDGLLYKPEGFDPKKKYPMIVNFYEKSSDGLYRHRVPSPGRSTINYPFYTSRGYVLFIPDIPYRDGYPGESAYNAVVPGVTSLINQGFIDRDRVGVQGHSWGGYQIAYLLTRTNIFKCAESGAPVVNMTSAYGGIRWETGLSRMFQYERTQSRIGGTLWEYPLRYIENSPLFTMDKVETPVLIMHNDKDGHVPWYQGIEYFVALRRLGKPAWMLNYNDEPHWPLRLENRKDFNIRLQQFFDHYLKDEPMPMWMKRGVPAMEKGIIQGYELSEDE